MDCQVDKLEYRADVQWSLKAKWERDMIERKSHMTDRSKVHIDIEDLCQKNFCYKNQTSILLL